MDNMWIWIIVAVIVRVLVLLRLALLALIHDRPAGALDLRRNVHTSIFLAELGGHELAQRLVVLCGEIHPQLQ